MAIRIKKKYFAKSNAREEEEQYGSFFKKASTSISFFINVVLVVIAGFFAPAVIINSLISKDIMLMLANILLSAGYLTNFIYRIYSNNITRSEILISCLCLTLALTIAFHFFPVIVSWNLINVVSFANFAATGLNGFFLMRPIIVPPLKKLAEYIANIFGYEIGGDFFSRKKLTPEDDRFVLDFLFTKHYKHDLSVKTPNEEQKLSLFNNMLKKLCGYINKYNEDLFGSISNAEKITNIEKLIVSLTQKGESDSCILFFNKKISYKRTKIDLLTAAHNDIDKAITNSNDGSKESFDCVAKKMRFFESFKYGRINTDRTNLLKEAKDCLSKEIMRQEKKLNGDDNGCIGLLHCRSTI